MHVQRPFIEDVIARAHRLGKPVVLGGPSVSGCPEHYPDADLIQVGEMGDSTDAIIEWLDEHAGRPGRSSSASTPATRLPLTDFPLPAYHLIRAAPVLHLEHPVLERLPVHVRVLRHPRALRPQSRGSRPPSRCWPSWTRCVAGGAVAIYFVDDNFIANQKAALELLPHLVEWQRRNRFPVRFACEATLNIAKNERVLALMRDAGFNVVFCGIETPGAGRAPLDVQGPEPPHAHPRRGRAS